MICLSKPRTPVSQFETNLGICYYLSSRPLHRNYNVRSIRRFVCGGGGSQTLVRTSLHRPNSANFYTVAFWRFQKELLFFLIRFSAAVIFFLGLVTRTPFSIILYQCLSFGAARRIFLISSIITRRVVLVLLL